MRRILSRERELPLRNPLRFRIHSWTHPEGGRDWPFEPPPTCSRSHAEKKVAIPSGSNEKAWEMRLGSPRCTLPNLHRNARAEVQINAGRCPEVQGMQDRVPA